MEKPILATNLDDFLIDHSAFIEPHRDWFEKVINLTKDESLRQWVGKKDYFKGVDIAMKQVMPNATLEQRTFQARHWYQEAVVKYIEDNLGGVKIDLIEQLIKLKESFKLALITTNTKDYANKILNVAGLSDIYDIIFATNIDEEPNKGRLIREFIEKNGKPKYYVTGKFNEEINEFLKKNNIIVLSVEDIYKVNPFA